jgi:hypothetical protein
MIASLADEIEEKADAKWQVSFQLDFAPLGVKFGP